MIILWLFLVWYNTYQKKLILRSIFTMGRPAK